MKLKINEKEYNLVWGLPAINQFCENLNMHDDMEGAFNVAFPVEGSDVKVLASIKARVELVYSALEVGAELDGVKLDLSRLQLQHWIDEAEQGEVSAIFDDFFKSRYMGKAIEEYLFQSVEESAEEALIKKSQAAS